VVEAAEYSGTALPHAAAGAESRGFRHPCNVTNKGSWTPNTLIKQGAKLVATWEDVWGELPYRRTTYAPAEGGNDRRPGKPHLYSGKIVSTEKKIFALLKADESHIDEMCGTAGAYLSTQ